MDWHIFETAGKYAGLGGIAVIVLLYLFRQILKLNVFGNVGRAGTLSVINNIINKVFWVTIVALVAWITVALFGKQAQSSQPSDSGDTVSTIPGQSMQVSDLPSDLLSPVDEGSATELTRQLGQRRSLTLNGSTLTIGAPGQGRTVTIACNSLRMVNGARIITNGNHLVLVALNARFGENAGINSFSPQTVKAGTGGKGETGGKVRMNVVQSMSGALRVSLPGQNGGDGDVGAAGTGGVQGSRGANAVKGVVDCHSGGGDGGQGGPGGKGATGGTGGNGGDGGEVVLQGAAAANRGLVDFEAPGGQAGLGGAGGPGGPGGPGGEGGSGDGPCSGGHGGATGVTGPRGEPGLAGNLGNPGKRTP